MALRPVMVNIKAVDATAAGRFWGEAAEVARLRALGASGLDVGQGDVPWTCLTDPEGHEFRVLAPS